MRVDGGKAGLRKIARAAAVPGRGGRVPLSEIQRAMREQNATTRKLKGVPIVRVPRPKVKRARL